MRLALKGTNTDFLICGIRKTIGHEERARRNRQPSCYNSS